MILHQEELRGAESVTVRIVRNNAMGIEAG